MAEDGLEKCILVDLPKISDDRGVLSFAQENGSIPFSFKRIFYLYNMKNGTQRGGHAHISLQQFLICINGVFNIHLSDGISEKKIVLNEPHQGLYVPAGIWVDLKSIKNTSICVVLASDLYRESDYIRNYDAFLSYKKRISG